MLNPAIRLKTLLIFRETFLALLPVVLIMNSLVMLLGLTQLLYSWGIPIPNIATDDISRLYYFLIPLFVSLSLSTILAKEKSLDPIGTLLISMVCFLRGTHFLSINKDAQIISSHGSVLTSIAITWLAVRLLHHFSTKHRLHLISNDAPHRSELSPRLVTALNLVIPGFCTVLCIELLRQTIVMLSGINPLAQTDFSN